MTKNPLFKILFVLLSIAFIGFTIFNWTSKTPNYQETQHTQIKLARTFATEINIPAQSVRYTSTPSKFLIDPFLIDSTFYFTKMNGKGVKFNAYRWEKIKKHINYREPKIPREVNIYYGSSAYVDSDKTATSKVVDNTIIDLEISYSFSKSSKLFLYLSYDSILHFYDQQDQLRESISHKRFSSDKPLNQHKTYEYDDFGNLLTYCEFHSNDKGEKYLFSYNTFKYAPSSEGLHVKKTMYTKEYEKDAYEKETVYFSFDTALKLQQRTRIFSVSYFGGNPREVTQKFSYSYDEHGKLSHLLQESSSGETSSNSWKRDAKGRLVLHEEKFSYGQTFRNNKDSIVYHSPYEKTEYYFEITSKASKEIERKVKNINFFKEDTFGNTIFTKIVDNYNPTNKAAWLYIDQKLKYLPNKTWYYQKQTLTYPYQSKEDKDENDFSEDYYDVAYREFTMQSTIPDAQYTYTVNDEIENLKSAFKATYLKE